MTKRFLGVLLTGLAAATIATGADKPKAATKPAPDEKAQMEAMMRASTPGENHKRLEAFVGTFDAKVKMWDKPGAPPQGDQQHRFLRAAGPEMDGVDGIARGLDAGEVERDGDVARPGRRCVVSCAEVRKGQSAGLGCDGADGVSEVWGRNASGVPAVLHPVFHLQPTHPVELTPIVRDHDKTFAARVAAEQNKF